jgi:hypothetical protein
LKWVTWEKVGVDRIACAWLIRRQIDPDAEFVFIQRGSDYKAIEGIPFDIPGAHLSHKRGRCTFATILKEYAISDKILDQVATIVDGADSATDLLPPPESSGLDLICRGLTKVLRDDLRAIETGSTVFDAIYAQLADQS